MEYIKSFFSLLGALSWCDHKMEAEPCERNWASACLNCAFSLRFVIKPY